MGKRGNPNWRKGGESPNPTGKKQERRDGWSNSATGHGTSLDRRRLTRYGIDVVTDLEARQLWRSEWLCRRIIEVLPGEANRRGWDLKCDDKDLVERVEARAEELDLDGAMTRAAEYERAYGGAAILPVVSGALGTLAQPLEDDATIVSVDALHVLEPCELTPTAYHTDLSSPKFGKPEKYRFMAQGSGRSGYLPMQEIHESRLIIFPGRRVSRQTQPGQREGWGDSELNQARSAIADVGLTWGSVATLLHEFGQGVYEIKGLSDMMAQKDGPEQLQRRMDAMDFFKSTMRATAIDAEDSYTRMDTPASGLDGLLMQQAQWISAIADMPIEVLFGREPAGLSATGEMTVRNWYAKVEKVDATHYAPRREQIVKLLILEDGGKEPELWSVESKPLWTPSEAEVANTRLVDAQRAAILIDKGIASADDIAESFYGGDTYSPEISIDWAAREEQKKIDEEQATAMQEATLEAMNKPAVDPNAPQADEPPAPARGPK
jgi:phage-related protein (TIGR01555 family)